MAKRTYTDKDLQEILQVAADLAEEVGRPGLADMLREAADVNYEFEYSVLWATETDVDLSWLEPGEDREDYVVLAAIVQRRRGDQEQESWETVDSLGNITFNANEVVFHGRLYEDQLTRADDRWLANHVHAYQIEVSRELLTEAHGG